MNDILFAAEFAKELEAEVPSTLKCLERIPLELSGWKPHEKSMEFGYLALLVAEIPLWITHIIKKSEIDFATFQHYKPTSTRDMVNHFKQNVAEAKETLLSVKDGELGELFYLKANGQVLFSSSKKENVESTINHMVHHRGQLTVYMRLNDIAVPSIYGPSADDKSFTTDSRGAKQP
ncbi:DinB family protein [Mucilaginibacter ginsenosidivorans]|uniref:Damage-inducible protein DinB n=1 Tax=Mucilaginibacter ginsenosidivorans TaxID=398053 RepID=A0A5B8USZ7_9SPHI|nr:DinB family protein [Mucilaginibacter ginsenosidivorans]QEC61835.1 damage-inducible protein DinB [Mucilaginibacter ginsenosidivorans]